MAMLLLQPVTKNRQRDGDPFLKRLLYYIYTTTTATTAAAAAVITIIIVIMHHPAITKDQILLP